MRVARFWRSLLVSMGLLLMMLAPLTAAAADPVRFPDIRYVITRLGDQPVLVAPTANTAATSVQSFRFSAQGQITAKGEKGALKIGLKGEAASPDRVHMTLTLTDTTSSTPIPPIELIVVGSTPYIYLPADIAPDGKATWVLIDNASSLFGGAAGMGMNMPNLANLPPISSDTQTLGDETINGTATTHMRTTIDATALLSGSAKNAKPSKLTADIWTGKADGFPRRVAVNGTFALDLNALASLFGSAGDLTDLPPLPPVEATVTFTVDFTDINASVTITPPTTFIKLSDALK